MKKLFVLLALLLSFQAFSASADYRCGVRSYKVDLTVDGSSTAIWFYEGYDLLALGYVKWIESKGNDKVFHFYPGNSEPLKLIFKAVDIEKLPLKMTGWIDAMPRGFILWDKLSCHRI